MPHHHHYHPPQPGLTVIWSLPYMTCNQVNLGQLSLSLATPRSLSTGDQILLSGLPSTWTVVPLDTTNWNWDSATSSLVKQGSDPFPILSEPTPISLLITAPATETASGVTVNVQLQASNQTPLSTPFAFVFNLLQPAAMVTAFGTGSTIAILSAKDANPFCNTLTCTLLALGPQPANASVSLTLSFNGWTTTGSPVSLGQALDEASIAVSGQLPSVQVPFTSQSNGTWTASPPSSWALGANEALNVSITGLSLATANASGLAILEARITIAGWQDNPFDCSAWFTTLGPYAITVALDTSETAAGGYNLTPITGGVSVNHVQAGLNQPPLVPQLVLTASGQAVAPPIPGGFSWQADQVTFPSAYALQSGSNTLYWVDTAVSKAVTSCQIDLTQLTPQSPAPLDFSGIDLAGQDFTGWSNLAGANFAGCQLTGANLTSADLTGATVDGADFTGAAIDYVVWANVDISQASGLPVSVATISNLQTSPGTAGVGLNFTTIPGLTLATAALANVSFENAILSGLCLARADLSGANFTNADLTGASLEGATLTGATFGNATLDNASCALANFDGATLTGASLNGTRFIGANVDTIVGTADASTAIWVGQTAPAALQNLTVISTTTAAQWQTYQSMPWCAPSSAYGGSLGTIGMAYLPRFDGVTFLPACAAVCQDDDGDWGSFSTGLGVPGGYASNPGGTSLAWTFLNLCPDSVNLSVYAVALNSAGSAGSPPLNWLPPYDWQYSIDGGTPSTLTSDQGAQAPASLVTQTTVNPLTSGMHTITFTNGTAGESYCPPVAGILIQPPLPQPGTLNPWQSLSPNDVIASPGGSCQLAFHADGNLCLQQQQNGNWVTLDSSNTANQGAAAVMLLDSGILCVLDANGNCLWQNDSTVSDGAQLVVQDTAPYLQILDTSGTVLATGLTSLKG